MTVRVWLIGFVLLFVGVETLDWLFQLGGSDGYWVMLGGLGLAAASNAKHLPKLGETRADAGQIDAESFEVGQSKRNAEKTVNKSTANKTTTDKNTERSEDSISFRVRLPWR